MNRNVKRCSPFFPLFCPENHAIIKAVSARFMVGFIMEGLADSSRLRVKCEVN